MRTVLPAIAILVVAFTALAGNSKSDKPAADTAEMDCDHPAAKDAATASAVGPHEPIIRGEKIGKGPTVRLADLQRSPERHDGKTVVVEGTVRRACTRMGCWMELAQSDSSPGVRVTFKDYGFFVPVDSAGAKAKVEGTVKVTALSDAAVKHYQAEGGRVPTDSHGKHVEVQLVATGVELRR
ncbi:MAG TPA: DUF4920 domain-containing protein [Myxococcaceae bacterium]|nr:DUF4920 domain-containing protein [Myxococcaceae bacterium]